MTIQKRLRYGERAISTDLNTKGGLLQVSQVPAAQPASPPIQVSRWARNGKHPNALLESMKAEAINSAAMWKAKEAYRSPGYFGSGIGLINSNNAVQPRWRCAFHTGPFTQFLDVSVLVGPDPTYATAASFTQFDLTSSAGTTTETFPVGASVWANAFVEGGLLVTRRMQVTPGTDYTGMFTDNGTSSAFAHIVELASMTGLNGGYLSQNIATTGPIVDGYRQNAAEILRALWQQGAWPLGSWSLEDGTQIPSISTTTPTNVMDTACVGGITTLGSQAVSPNSPGWIIDTTGHGRRSQTSSGIPVVLAVYGNGVAAGARAGNFSLVDPSGVAWVSGSLVFDTSGVGAWVRMTGTLPMNTLQKYDLLVSAPAATPAVSFYAASLYELG